MVNAEFQTQKGEAGPTGKGGFMAEPGQWDAIVSIFCHLPPELREDVHRRCVIGLRDKN